MNNETTQEDFSQDSVYDFDSGMAGYQHLLRVNKVVSEALRAARRLSRGKNEICIVEIGCGEGRLLDSVVTALKRGFPDVNYIVTGVDLSPVRIATARRMFPHYSFFEGDRDSIISERKADIVICSEVIEHVTDPLELVATIVRNLTVDGYAIITTPNINTLDNAIKVLFGRDVKPDIPGHLREYTYGEFKQILKKNLYLESYSSIGFRLPLYGSGRRLMNSALVYRIVFPLAHIFPFWGRILIACCKAQNWDEAQVA